MRSRGLWPVWTVEQHGSPRDGWEVGGIREKWWIKELERMEEEIWKDWGREDERWLCGCSFDPSLSDAPFNVLTETTWGTPREVVCLFISARGRGITRLWRAVSLVASTLGWLKDTDGPLPQSVSVFAELGGPAAWCQRQKTASVTQIQETPQKTILCFTGVIMVLLMMKSSAHKSVHSLLGSVLWMPWLIYYFCGSAFDMEKKNLLPYNLFILLSPQPDSIIHVIIVIYKWGSHPPLCISSYSSLAATLTQPPSF